MSSADPSLDMFFWQPPVLETPRLLLRPFQSGDVDAYYRICSNPRMTQFTLWDTHTSREDTRLFVEQYAPSRLPEKVPEPLAITLRSTGELVGSIGCFWSAQSNEVMELGYNVAEAFWGQGIAVEASRKLLDYVFENYEVERIQARIFAGNSASGRVAVKVGMTYEGTLRSLLRHRGRYTDVEYYSILRLEWLQWPGIESD
ncbi:GNAT family N-acetyltransferase [Telmatocola sphagniphila]|uniref:GNAT family N-acetyltransferase n=1 Tax=Telmatocola sphagniphila TaxID=1123043 RepID=A0A8E6B782_9BACT|nr:GNAT family protein [Telmatocola sphagniphila]QVL33163.1 GNAT family N-acetyltransferase [Telmatocola sphagniphila]